MSDLTEYERRISAALEAIGTTLDGLAAAPAQGDDTGGAEAELASLRSALEDEKLANAQLQERNRVLHDKAEAASASSADAAATGAKITALDKEMQHLRHVNAQLREQIAALQKANAEGLAEPHLINRAMMTELEALRAAQAADRAELDAILGDLEPLVKEGA